MFKPRIGFLVIIFFAPILTWFFSYFTPYFTDPFVRSLSTACDYSYGGGSYHLCYWDKLYASTGVSAVLAVLLLLILSREYLRKPGIPKDYGLGLLYLLLVLPVNVYIYDDIIKTLNIPFGNARGAFNDKLFPAMLVLNLVVLFVLSVKWKERRA